MFQIRLKSLREQVGYSQYSFADAFGVAQSTVGNWEAGKREPNFNTAQRLADFFNVTVDYLLGRDSKDNKTKALPIPVLGTIPAGIPIEAIEDILDYEEVPADWGTGGREYFALKIRGDSMFPDYLDGDVVIFEKAEDCNSGDECAVMVNGSDATFKKLIKQKTGIVLQPLNTSGYEPTFYSNREVMNLPVRVLGVAKELRRKK